MLRTPLARTPRGIAAAALLAAGTTALCGPASAESRGPVQLPAAEQPALAGPPVMAVVSVKDQRISIYDAKGNTLQSSISSGRSDYETPPGTYSILQKNKDHHSNLYDDASMPFMQRITWSGVALHEGVLPGYPASHGCVRLPSRYAEQIFSMTKIGMRVVIARDNIAPVEMTHPALFQPAKAGVTAIATPVSFGDQNTQEQPGSVFQADVRNWPERQAEIDALKASASVKEREAELAKQPVGDLAALKTLKAKDRAAAVKRWQAAGKAMRLADDAVAKANRDLASAKDPAKIKKADSAKIAADAAVIKAAQMLTGAMAAAAQPGTNDRDRKRLDRALRTAEQAKAKAELTAERAARDAISARAPERYKAQEAAAAKATEAAVAASQKHADALAARVAADTSLDRVSQDFAAATARMAAAAEAARDERRKTFPVSMFVSLKTQRLYVRQGHEEIVDVPVEIADPGRPIGTHVFTAVDYAHGADRLRWTAISLAHRPDVSNLDYSKKALKPEPYPTNTAIAAAALDRVTIPKEILTRFATSMWPGSSLIVSDEGLSKETNNATDFIVVMSGEPQGALKKRPKPKPMPSYFGVGSYYSAFASPSYGWGSQPPSYYYAPKNGSNAPTKFAPPKYGRYDQYGRPVRIQPKPKFGW